MTMNLQWVEQIRDTGLLAYAHTAGLNAQLRFFAGIRLFFRGCLRYNKNATAVRLQRGQSTALE